MGGEWRRAGGRNDFGLRPSRATTEHISGRLKAASHRPTAGVDTWQRKKDDRENNVWRKTSERQQVMLKLGDVHVSSLPSDQPLSGSFHVTSMI